MRFDTVDDGGGGYAVGIDFAAETEGEFQDFRPDAGQVDGQPRAHAAEGGNCPGIPGNREKFIAEREIYLLAVQPRSVADIHSDYSRSKRARAA